MAEETPVTIWDALEAKFSLPYHIFLREVRDDTGFYSSRSADAIAISLYASRGQALSAFEVKHSRSDWLGELKRPDKAETIGKYCDYFWLVTAEKTIAKLEEIPAKWGWLNFTGKQVRVMKWALKITGRPLDRAMLASLAIKIMRKYKLEGETTLKEQVAAGVKAEHSSLQHRLKSTADERDRLEKIIQDFEKASGVQMRWTRNSTIEIGNAVRRVLDGHDGAEEYLEQLKQFQQRAANLALNLEREITEADAVRISKSVEPPVLPT